MKKLIITEEQHKFLFEGVKDYHEYFLNIRELILSFDKGNIELAFEILNGLLTELSEYSEEEFIKDYFSDLYKLMPKEWVVDHFQSLFNYADKIDGTDGRCYVMDQLSQGGQADYILFDKVENKAYGIRTGGTAFNEVMVFLSIAIFNLNLNLLKFYGKVHGVDVYSYENRFLFRLGNDGYTFSNRSSIPIVIENYAGYYTFNTLEGIEPPISSLIRNEVTGKIKDNVNGYGVMFGEINDSMINVIFNSPKVYIEYVEVTSDVGSEYAIYLKTDKRRNKITIEKFKKTFPELAEYIEKIKNR